MNYVTIETVTNELGAGWAGNGDSRKAVLLANSWLAEQGLRPFAIVPEPVLAAGAYIAQEVIAGNMYQGRTEGFVTSKSVKAGSVSSSKTYAGGVNGRPLSSGEQIALSLIAPYLYKTPISVQIGMY